MKRIFGVLSLMIGLGGLTGHSGEPANADKLTRMLQQSTLTLLKEGNLRFAAGKPLHPNLDPARRVELAAAGQEPMATILACSDSRDPVEYIFDRGVGDLFVIRVAGNVAGLSELATMEYGVTHLDTPLLIVLGHSHCGAVTAAVKGGELPGHLTSLVALIQPAVAVARTNGPAEDMIPRAVELNVWQQVENLFTRSALLRAAAAAGKVQIVGAVYDIASGQVQWLEPHPKLDQLLAEAKGQPRETNAPSEPVPSSADLTSVLRSAMAEMPGTAEALPVVRTPTVPGADAVFRSVLATALANTNTLPDVRTQSVSLAKPAARAVLTEPTTRVEVAERHQ